MFLVGSHIILRSYDPTRSYIQSYHFYDPSAILNVLVRWDRKIMQFYDLNRDFDNHAYDIAEALAFVTCLHVGLGILLYCRPIVSYLYKFMD